jgi:hypothetical protein
MSMFIKEIIPIVWVFIDDYMGGEDWEIRLNYFCVDDVIHGLLAILKYSLGVWVSHGGGFVI